MVRDIIYFGLSADDLQRAVMNKLEREAMEFVRACLERKNKKDVEKILRKAEKILPYSEKLKAIVEA